MTRVWMTVIAGASLLIAADFAMAAEGGQGKAAGAHGAAAKAHKHVHKNGHNLLGAKLKVDGKHAVGKVSNRDVTAEVKGGKVVNMAAGDLAVKRVKSSTKMASMQAALTPVAWTGALQLAQSSNDYYGYCFDDGLDYTCYWYPASDVDYQDYTWDPYDPNY